MPGLIDAHVHTDFDGLHDALLFGVTTELEMMGRWSAREREKIPERRDVADIRSAGMGVTPPGGHPSQYMKSSSNLLLRLFYRYPFVSTPDETVEFVIGALTGELRTETVEEPGKALYADQKTLDNNLKDFPGVTRAIINTITGCLRNR